MFDSKLFFGNRLGDCKPIFRRLKEHYGTPDDNKKWSIFEYIGWLNTKLDENIYIDIVFPHTRYSEFEDDIELHVNLNDSDEIELSDIESCNMKEYSKLLHILDIEYSPPKIYIVLYEY